MLGTGFMRDREHSSCKPYGGILADVMGLGKTLMMFVHLATIPCSFWRHLLILAPIGVRLANIINGKVEAQAKKCRTTLIVRY